MKSLTVCMGSACHLKDALAVVEAFRDEIQRNGLAPYVELKGSFCLGNCTDAVVVKFEETVVPSVGAHNATEVFRERILPECRK